MMCMLILRRCKPLLAQQAPVTARIALPALLGAFACPGAWAAGPQLADLAPARAFAAPQISVAPPRPLPDRPAMDDLFIGMEEPVPQAEPTPDISYDFFWKPSAEPAWNRGTSSAASPGLRETRNWRRASRLGARWVGKSDRPWTFGASNWRYADAQGLSVTLGNEEIAAPAWGNSARLGGISVSQSSLVSAGDAHAWQYTMAVGALDYSTGQEDLNYGPKAGNTVVRYGLSPAFTLESQLELAPNLMTSGIGGQYQTDWGAWSAGVARASQGLYKGWRYQASYSVDLADTLRLSWLNERHTEGFADLSRYQNGAAAPGAAAPGGIRQRWTATVPMGRWGDVSGTYESARTSLGEQQRSFGFTQQFWYSPNLRVGLRAEREVVSGDYDIGIRFSVPIY